MLSPAAVSICLHIDFLYSVLRVILIPQLMKRKVDKIVLRSLDEALKLFDRLRPSRDWLRHCEHL